MANTRYEWPPDQDVLDGCVALGSRQAYAESLGIHEASLRRHLKRNPALASSLATALKARPHPNGHATTPGDEVSVEEKLRQQLTESQKALKGARSEDVREQRVLDAIVEHLPVKVPQYTPAPSRRPSKAMAHEFVLLWSDAHAGEVVSAEQTNGANSYDWEIMLARHRKLLDGVLSYKEYAGFPVDRLHVLGLGDGLAGNIHDELRETNEVPLAEATVQFGLDAGDWLADFVPHFREVRFSGVVGNHPRESKKPHMKNKYSNADWVTYQIMRQRLSRHPSVTFDIPKAQKHPIEVCGRRLMLLHGDSVGPSAMVGVPTGGIVRHVGRLASQYASMGKPIDHYVLGHFHEVNVYRGKRIIVNGNIKGPDEYGLERFGEADPPMQLLLVFNEKHGLTSINYIDLV